MEARTVPEQRSSVLDFLAPKINEPFARSSIERKLLRFSDIVEPSECES